MNLGRLDELQTVDPRPLPPWRAESFAEIEIGSDHTPLTLPRRSNNHLLGHPIPGSIAQLVRV
ncbi:uncharacterized protein N7525_000306 [Penicillium rubens]|uniref:uncharacterized protein n=1 Tax=Penicillium rubens TaxID=1108849 RepID=UPI002A5AF09F|nr:uncharacterized protein N7525_000306 [Penicillium rubens]KAJ5842565.1 hypothetical protein N7525_000306 [Penicillium rubens]